MKSLMLGAVAAIGCSAFAPLAAQESAIGYPRFFDPRQRCHDAPHRSDSETTYPARISVLPGGTCIVRQATGPSADYQLQGYQVIEYPAEGRLVQQSPTTYAYRAPRGGSGYDTFIVRLIYQGPSGRLFGPQLQYEVRVGR